MAAGTYGLVVVVAALLGAIAWNLITWYFGLPSSSSHALIGGLVGAGLAAAPRHWSQVVDKVVVPMVVSPVVGFALAYLFMLAILWVFRRGHRHRVMRRFRGAQIISASAMALGHGLQDAQKTMGVVVLALVAGGFQEDPRLPVWVILGAAGAIRSAPTRAAGGSCAPSAAGSSSSTRPRVRGGDDPRRRCCT